VIAALGAVLAGCSKDSVTNARDAGVGDAGLDAGGDGSAPGQPDLSAGEDAGSNEDGGNNDDAGGTLTASPFFGIDVINTNASNYPTLSYGIQRFWSSQNFQWQTLQVAACADVTTCAGGYDAAYLAAFDTFLAHMATAGVNEAIYTMARTPNFASTFPTDTTCNNTATGDGACDRPIGLNDDGTGDNTIYRNWYAFLAKHLNDPTYRATHAHVRYWEIWNEPDSVGFWGDGAGGHGSYAALVRMAEDMRCMLTGKGVVTNYPTVGAKTPCAQAGLPAINIDPSALIMSPSYHALPSSTTQLQDFLYCSDATHDATCNTGAAGAAAVDIINLHMKPGGGCVSNGASPPQCTATTSVEPTYTAYLKNVRAVLQPTEQGKPLWNDEADYDELTFIAPYTDDDMAASYVSRFLMMGWSLGVASHDWTPWDHFKTYPTAVTAWNTLYSWIIGSKLTTPCAAVGATQVYTCGITKDGVEREIIWDSSKACASGVCTSAPYTVPTEYTTYADSGGDSPSDIGACTGCAAHQVPLGVKPLLLSP
jgi:hypothetical protein